MCVSVCVCLGVCAFTHEEDIDDINCEKGRISSSQILTDWKKRSRTQRKLLFIKAVILKQEEFTVSPSLCYYL